MLLRAVIGLLLISLTDSLQTSSKLNCNSKGSAGKCQAKALWLGADAPDLGVPAGCLLIAKTLEADLLKLEQAPGLENDSLVGKVT